MDKFSELNNILDKEIEFCEEFENLLLQKQQLVIRAKVNQLKDFDEKIYAAQKKLELLKNEKYRVTQQFGDKSIKISQIINNINDLKISRELEEKRCKLKTYIKKIQITNNVIRSLIEHSLKLIDGSINEIATSMAKTQTKGDYYNKNGVKDKHEIQMLSAIIEEA